MLPIAAVAAASSGALGVPLNGHPAGRTGPVGVPPDTLGLRPRESAETFSITSGATRDDVFTVPSLSVPAWAAFPLDAADAEDTVRPARRRAEGTAARWSSLADTKPRTSAVTLADVLGENSSFDDIGRLFPNERALGASGLARFIPAPGAAAPVGAAMLASLRRRRP